MSTINKKFMRNLRKDIKVEGRGTKIICHEGVKNGLTYMVPKRGADANTAQAINSRMPVMTISGGPNRF